MYGLPVDGEFIYSTDRTPPRLNVREEIMLNAAFEYHNNGILFTDGGYSNQPKLFWDIVQLIRATDNAYARHELDAKK